MSIDQSALPRVSTTFDLAAFGQALAVGDLGYQLARYAVDAEIRVITDTPPRAPRVVSGTPAISAWLHESAVLGATAAVSHLVDGGDRVAFTRHWRRLDGTNALSVSTAELEDGLITTQHTILVINRDPDAGLPDG
jgi:hypothetical protein